VTLINTEGLALIGPGSEWFWTALQFTVLATTFIAIYRQLQAQHVQMAENTKLLRSQAHHNALTLSQRARELLIENEGFARILNVGWQTPDAMSDVDLLVVGDVSLRELVEALGPIQNRVGREVSPMVYPVPEFREKLGQGHRFLTSVLEGPKLFLIGSPHELERLAREVDQVNFKAGETILRTTNRRDRVRCRDGLRADLGVRRGRERSNAG